MRISFHPVFLVKFEKTDHFLSMHVPDSVKFVYFVNINNKKKQNLQQEW